MGEISEEEKTRELQRYYRKQIGLKLDELVLVVGDQQLLEAARELQTIVTASRSSDAEVRDLDYQRAQAEKAARQEEGRRRAAENNARQEAESLRYQAHKRRNAPPGFRCKPPKKENPAPVCETPVQRKVNDQRRSNGGVIRIESGAGK